MRRHIVSLAGALAVVLLLSACAAGSAESGNRAFTRALITQQDLDALPQPITLYELFRQHSRVRIRQVGGREALVLETRGAVMTGARGDFAETACEVYIGNSRMADPITLVRDLTTDQVRRIEILRPSEASARYGGDGHVGIIAIQMRS